ncbi:MAG: lipoprotein signal peptidase [Prevotellaceae bacterium]|jgi:signal peptidase II|nr:lipoprotein signal peptidase [Prevotellaceae bacterium]
MRASPGKIAVIIIGAVLAIDQAVKIWIKTHMALNQEFAVFGDWFIIHFTENPGMAFGMTFGGDWGKLLLSVFRVVLVICISFYLVKLSRLPATPRGVMVGLSLILAGAAGNIIDSLFYGLLFDHSYGQIAAFLPESGGYASFLHGKVVDMLYFPIIKDTAGDPLFFRPIFNIADTAITTGIFYLLLFQRRFFATRKAQPGNETLTGEEDGKRTVLDSHI